MDKKIIKTWEVPSLTISEIEWFKSMGCIIDIVSETAEVSAYGPVTYRMPVRAKCMIQTTTPEQELMLQLRFASDIWLIKEECEPMPLW